MSRLHGWILVIVAGISTTGCGVTLNDVSPDAASVGSSVTLSGVGFGPSQGVGKVFFAGVDGGVASAWTDTSITVAVPAGATTGPITVRVGSLTSNDAPFIVSAPAAQGLALARALSYPASLQALASYGGVESGLTTDVGVLSSTQESTAVGDLNEDLNPDIVSTTGGSNCCVFLGDGAGRFAAAECMTVPGPAAQGGGIAVADVDEDNHLDLVASLNGAIVVFLGDGTGAFDSPLTVAQLVAFPLLTKDLDLDSHVDIVARQGNELHLSHGMGNGMFTPASILSVGTGTQAIGSDDLNGDGWPDLVTSNYSSGDLSVVLSDGAGGFLAEQRIDVDMSPTGLVVEDLSGDGKVDVALTHDGFSSTNDVMVFLGNGQGQLTSGQVIPEAGMMQSLASADMNGDGVLDLLAGSNTGVHTLLGYGDGTFVHWDSSYATYARGIAVGDFNRDGRADIAQHGLSGSPVMLGDGSGQFAKPLGVPLEPYGLDGVRATDLNHDGKADFVVLDEVAYALQALLGDGAGGFTVIDSPLIGRFPSDGKYNLGDFDGDGNTDAIVYREPSGYVLDTYRGDGLGGFTPWGTTTISFVPAAITIGDMDGDGKEDFVLGVWDDLGQSVSVWLSNGQGMFAQSVMAFSGARPEIATGLAVDRVNDDERLDIVFAAYPPPAGDGAIRVLLANAVGGYDLATQIPANGGELRLVDMDQDGDLDIVRKDFDVGNGCPGPYEVYLGDGTGQLVGPIVSPCRGPLSAVVDVNGDTFPDVVSSRLTVDVSLGTGTGALVATPDSFWLEGIDFHPYSDGAADVNEDGKMDFARVDGSGEVRIFLGDGTGGFVDLSP